MEYKQIRSIFSPKISETIIIPVNQDAGMPYHCVQ